MTVAVIGGGIQGCTVALELAARGRRVVLFERAAALMDGASRWNEGKIHLGYTYANDATLETARVMVRGAISFGPKLAQYLQASPETLFGGVHERFTYAVHRDSLLAPERVRAYIRRVDGLLADALAAPGSSYLGETSPAASNDVERPAAIFDGYHITTAVRTPERAVDTHGVADRMASRVAADPAITVALLTTITRIERSGATFRLCSGDGTTHGPFTSVVNAAWESRLALDRTLGYEPPRAWLHRYKVAVHARTPSPESVPSVSVVLGPFGDLVNLGDGRVYLSWYPVCRLDTSSEIAPRHAAGDLDGARRHEILEQSVAALAQLVPALRRLPLDRHAARVRGGHIVAWGATDIGDAASLLHSRHDVGVHSRAGHHSVDTGKYGLAPLNAVEVARRIDGDV